MVVTERSRSSQPLGQRCSHQSDVEPSDRMTQQMDGPFVRAGRLGHELGQPRGTPPDRGRGVNFGHADFELPSALRESLLECGHHVPEVLHPGQPFEAEESRSEVDASRRHRLPG
jgi:hypothetical protein